MSSTFARLGVPEPICRALARGGITQPFQIQAAVIADALDGRDICGRAPTGSGKTLAFGIPLVVNVTKAKPKRPRALVLAPTRELTDQIAAELRTFAGHVRVGVVYGGVGYGAQVGRLRQGVDILVACPGRLEDLIDRKVVSLREVEQVVIDEADRMADMGFLPAVRRLLDQTENRRQTLMFSATLDKDVTKLTRQYQHQPVTHRVGDVKPDISAADHRFWRVGKTERVAACVDVITAVGSTIVFCRTRHGSDRLARQLALRGVEAAAIHGGHAQSRRTRTLRQFTNGRIKALVATDVAARGIHVPEVASVIHFDPPENQKTYLHRSGRTARAGLTGLVVSLVQPEQVTDTKKIQRQLGLRQPIIRPDRLDSNPATPRRRNGAQPGASGGVKKSNSAPQNGRQRPKAGHAGGGGTRSNGAQRRRHLRYSSGRSVRGGPPARPQRQYRNRPRSGVSSR